MVCDLSFCLALITTEPSKKFAEGGNYQWRALVGRYYKLVIYFLDIETIQIF